MPVDVQLDQSFQSSPSLRRETPHVLAVAVVALVSILSLLAEGDHRVVRRLHELGVSILSLLAEGDPVVRSAPGTVI